MHVAVPSLDPKDPRMCRVAWWRYSEIFRSMIVRFFRIDCSDRCEMYNLFEITSKLPNLRDNKLLRTPSKELFFQWKMPTKELNQEESTATRRSVEESRAASEKALMEVHHLHCVSIGFTTWWLSGLVCHDLHTMTVFFLHLWWCRIASVNSS